MNKKGFTLVEILSVIVLIALLLGIGIPGISRISNNMKKKSQNTKVNLIEQAGVLWGQANKTMLQTDTCNIDGVGSNIPCRKISVYGLIDEDYLDSEKKGELVFINSETDKSMLNDCVYVYKKNNRVYAKFKGVPSEGEECSPTVFEGEQETVSENKEYGLYECTGPLKLENGATILIKYYPTHLDENKYVLVEENEKADSICELYLDEYGSFQTGEYKEIMENIAKELFPQEYKDFNYQNQLNDDDSFYEKTLQKTFTLTDGKEITLNFLLEENKAPGIDTDGTIDLNASIIDIIKAVDNHNILCRDYQYEGYSSASLREYLIDECHVEYRIEDYYDENKTYLLSELEIGKYNFVLSAVENITGKCDMYITQFDVLSPGNGDELPTINDTEHFCHTYETLPTGETIVLPC